MNNKKSFLFKIATLTAVFTLNISLYVSLNKTTERVDAYSTSSLPTTIDLNDCTEQEIRSYYSSLNSLDASQRKGTNLLKNLKPILSNNQKYYSYDSGSAIWQMYEITDRDWSKSPASSITYGTYNANTKIISNYTYGTSASNSKNNPYIHALYINRNVNNQTTAWDDHQQTEWGINREHIWAKSHGFQEEGSGGARGDPMHLWAANGYANNIHSNYFYAFVDKTKTYTDCGSTYSNISNNLRGTSKNIGSGTVFEPQDCDKGDIARSIFYMVARYNNYANAASGFDTDNPNLVLLNNLSENTITGTSTADQPYGMGLLRDLLAWNKLDPVDEYEIHRNNILYKNYTNNRNPFIDFPSWADAIWGTADLDGTNYNSTITKTASPSTDAISTFQETFTISSDSINLEVGETATISGSNATSNISWSISDNTVASLNKITTTNNELVTITALKAGATTITATSGGNNATCTVTVEEPINYGTLSNPLTVDEAIDVINITGTDETPEPLYIRGIVSSNTAYKQQYSNYDEIWLEDDSGTAHSFELYRAKLDNGITGNYTAEDSMVGKEVVVYGYGKVYKGQPELTTSSNTPTSPMILSMTDPTPVVVGPTDYLNNTTSYMELTANETTSAVPNTITKTTNQLVTANSWNVSSGNNMNGLYTNFNLDSNINISTTGQANCGSVWGSGTYDWRLYQNKNGNIIITALNDCLITSIKLTYSTSSSGVLKYGNTTLTSGTAVNISSLSSVTFTVANSGSGTNGQVRITAFSVTYSSGSTTIDSVAINYGATISKSDWNAINALDGYEITDYGAMLVKKNTLTNTYHLSSVEEAYNGGQSVYIANKGSGATPNEEGDNYYFYIQLNVTRASNYPTVYVAVPFIKVNDVYYFLDELECSVNSLAQYYLDNGGSDLSTASLNILAGN
ncbi:MAG: endonuclease [Bacilli bacterium]|nr:endonuclease [Bacilli bacterium]